MIDWHNCAILDGLSAFWEKDVETRIERPPSLSPVHVVDSEKYKDKKKSMLMLCIIM